MTVNELMCILDVYARNSGGDWVVEVNDIAIDNVVATHTGDDQGWVTIIASS